jgi:hypothetical protein
LCLDADKTIPTFFSFVITDDRGTKSYGACLIIYEPLPLLLRNKLKPLYYLNNIDIFAPKALCIISSYSFISQYKEILKQLYRLHLSQCALPIERYICNFTDEIPIPAKGTVLVQFEMGTTVISFARPLDQIQPYATVRLPLNL